MSIVPHWLSEEVIETTWMWPACPDSVISSGSNKSIFYAETDTGLYTSLKKANGKVWDPWKKPEGSYRVIAGVINTIVIDRGNGDEDVEELDMFCSWGAIDPDLITDALPPPVINRTAHALYKFRWFIAADEVVMVRGMYTFPGSVGTEI
jgi:hypothetical protein